MGTSEASQSPMQPGKRPTRDSSGGDPAAPHASGNASLDHAAEGWIRRGFTIRYADPYLVQVMRREGLQPRDIGALAAVGAVCAVCLVVVLAVIRGRPWRVATLVARPDGRIQMHQQVTRRLPRG